jgi:hypothetical protein
VTGSRTVFEATLAARRPARLVYTSSVAAYGYHPDNPVPLTEDTPTLAPTHTQSTNERGRDHVLRSLNHVRAGGRPGRRSPATAVLGSSRQVQRVVPERLAPVECG